MCPSVCWSRLGTKFAAAPSPLLVESSDARKAWPRVSESVPATEMPFVLMARAKVPKIIHD